MQHFRTSTLSLLAAAWLALAPHQTAAESPASSAVSDPASSEVDTEPTNSKQTYILVPRGQAWQSNRKESGRAFLFASGSPRLLEFDLELTGSGTHVQRTHRQGATGQGTLVYREWRRTQVGSQAGRSLLREWAGGAVRHQGVTTPANGLTWLAWIEREREHRADLPIASSLRIFSDQECKWIPALVVRTALGPPGGLRIVDLLPMDGSRNSRLVFAGTQLLGFLEGDYEGILTSEVTRTALAFRTNL